VKCRQKKAQVDFMSLEKNNKVELRTQPTSIKQETKNNEFYEQTQTYDVNSR